MTRAESIREIRREHVLEVCSEKYRTFAVEEALQAMEEITIEMAYLIDLVKHLTTDG